MRSVRKAPPPPPPLAASSAPFMPTAPAFDPEQRETGTGKRRAPAPPASQPVSDQPPRYDQVRMQRPPPASSEFTVQLNQAMAGRRWPSESDI